MQKSSIPYLIFCLFLLAGCSQSSADAQTDTKTENPAQEVAAKPIYDVIDIPAFKAKIEAGNVKLVDVRRPAEFAAGHIEGAVNINVLAEDFKAKMQEYVQPDETLLLYCKSGKRSGKAARQMQDLGYNIIYDLKGGYMAWAKQ